MEIPEALRGRVPAGIPSCRRDGRLGFDGERSVESAGIQLIDAGGYPIETKDGMARFNPGNLRFGQSRTLYLTFQVPTDAPGAVSIQGLQLGFQNREGRETIRLADAFSVACVENPADVMASIHQESWAAQVVQEDFGRLKAAVADALREGNEEQARAHIEAYRKEKEAINRVMVSPQVSANLNKECGSPGGYGAGHLRRPA